MFQLLQLMLLFLTIADDDEQFDSHEPPPTNAHIWVVFLEIWIRHRWWLPAAVGDRIMFGSKFAMKHPVKNSNVEYNLRWWASGIQWGLFAAPFVIFNLIAEDSFDHMSSDYEYLEAITGCTLLLISLSLIGFVPSIARACARDRSRYHQTMKASVNAAVIIFIALIFALSMYAWSYFVS